MKIQDKIKQKWKYRCDSSIAKISNEELRDIVQKDWVDMITAESDHSEMIKAVEWAYTCHGKPLPLRIEIHPSPYRITERWKEYVQMSRDLKKAIEDRDEKTYKELTKDENLGVFLKSKKKAAIVDWCNFTINCEPSFSSAGGIQDYYWASFNDFKIRKGQTSEITKDMLLWENMLLTGVADLMLTDQLALVQERPIELHYNERGQLHNDKGAAILCKDGRGVYYLNNVSMFVSVEGNEGKQVCSLPPDQVDPKLYLKYTNADAKAEFLRKVGVNRMKSLGKVLDSWENFPKDNKNYDMVARSQYELVDMSSLLPPNSSAGKALYLNMVHGTDTSITHMEGVAPNCKNISDALSFKSFGHIIPNFLGDKDYLFLDSNLNRKVLN